MNKDLVVLYTSPQAEGQTYTVKINGVKDVAAAGNASGNDRHLRILDHRSGGGLARILHQQYVLPDVAVGDSGRQQHLALTNILTSSITRRTGLM